MKSICSCEFPIIKQSSTLNNTERHYKSSCILTRIPNDILLILLTKYLNFQSVLPLCRINRETKEKFYLKGNYNWIQGQSSFILAIYVKIIVSQTVTLLEYSRLNKIENLFNVKIFPSQHIYCLDASEFSNIKLLKLNDQMPKIHTLKLPSYSKDEDLMSLGKFTCLRELSLDGCSRITDAIPSLTEISSLQCLSLNRCSIMYPESLSKITSLQSLSLDDTYFGDKSLRILKGMTSLQSLSLNANHITDSGLSNLSGLTLLQSLSLIETNITGSGLSNLSGLTLLQRLFIDPTTEISVEKIRLLLPRCVVEKPLIKYSHPSWDE